MGSIDPSKEPVAWGGAITALATAGIPLLRAFNVNVTESQANAILGFLAALIVVGTLLVRSQVTPVTKAQDAISTALTVSPLDPVQPSPGKLLADATA